MAVQSKKEGVLSRDDVVTATSFLPHPLPKSKFPEQETGPAAAYQLVHDELLLDGNSRQNLATFCQTWVEPEIRKLMDECIDKNMIDKDEYPQTAEIESRCVRMLAHLWNAPADTQGCSTTGSSEAAMLGGLAMKTRWSKKRRASGKPDNRPNLICGPVQICWHKFARYFDVELREIPCEGERLHMSAEEVIRRCDENTIGVVATLGVPTRFNTSRCKTYVSRSTILKKSAGWTSRCMLMPRVAASSHRSFILPSCGTFACPESNPSMLPDTNSVLLHWDAAGRSGGKRETCRRS